jgi:hypothetical protein
LPGHQRPILRTAAANVVPKKMAAERGLEAETSPNICRKGRAGFDSAASRELRALRRAVEPVYDDLDRSSDKRAALDEIGQKAGFFGPNPAQNQQNLPENPAQVPSQQDREIVANKPNSVLESAIAPRRPPVRVRLAPSEGPSR